MANDAGLRASEIKGVLLSEIENYGEALQAEEVGEVLEVKDLSLIHISEPTRPY